MKEKKKVLFSFVGMRDPYSDGKFERLWKKIKSHGTYPDSNSEGSVLTTCKELKPDIVYLFPSSRTKAANPQESTEEKAYETRKILTWKLGIEECNVMPLMVDNATDYTQLYISLRSNMQEIFRSLAKNYPDEQDCINKRYELIFILTSGTPQMNQTAQLYLPSLPYEFKYYRSIDPKHATGKNRVFPVSLELVNELWLQKTIEANVEGYYFHSVVEQCETLKQISVIKTRKGRVQIIRDIFTSYENLDLMQYEEAYDKISRVADYCNYSKE